MIPANDHILAMAARWQAEGHDLALAVVIDTWGSSPRQRGALMAIRDDGQIAGSVSGGCVEGAVIESGLRLMTGHVHDGGTERLDFGVADEVAWRVGLSCGGRISVWVCTAGAMQAGVLAEANARIEARLPVAMICDLNKGIMVAAGKTGHEAGHGTGHEAGHGAGHGANTLDEAAGQFRLNIMPAPRVLIIGAVHISQHLTPMAMEAGFDVKVIDPRGTFANAERFPGVDLVDDWPQDALADMPLDAQTALVTLTHDPKIDDAALVMALPHPLFYIACLGSRRTHAKRLERLKEKGFDAAALSRIKGPAGLDIGAQTPAEIAVSVLAELIAALRGNKGREM